MNGGLDKLVQKKKFRFFAFFVIRKGKLKKTVVFHGE